MYKTTDKRLEELNYDSLQNQKIKEAFVEKHVYGCHTAEVEYILSRSDDDEAPLTYDCMSNYLSPCCEDCGYGHTSFTEKTHDSGDTIYVCDDCGRKYSIDEYLDLDMQSGEIFEWWSVSEFLAEKLSLRGEHVLTAPVGYYWGRQCTGQAISLDFVISKICESLEILEGQHYSWAT